MSELIKENFSAPQPGALVLDQLSEIQQSVESLHRRISQSELQRLRAMVQVLVSRVEQVIPSDEADQVISPEALEQARREDALAIEVMARAHTAVPQPMTTPESIERGTQMLAEAAAAAPVATEQRIARGELINSAQLQRALGIGKQAISGALKAGRMFAMVGPSGDYYYPAYFADPTLDRRPLEQVSKVLGTLPAGSKHFFFTTPSIFLQSTPLDALRKGRVADVLTAAAGFAER